MRTAHRLAALSLAGALVLSSASVALAGGRPFMTALSGTAEVPGPGDPDGTGTAEIRVDPGAPRICWNVYARQIDAAIAAHVHRGAAGSAGPPVVTLTTPGADGRSEGCAAIEAGLAREIAMQPHLVDLHIPTPDFRAGAIRGQLRGIVSRAPRTR